MLPVYAKFGPKTKKYRGVLSGNNDNSAVQKHLLNILILIAVESKRIILLHIKIYGQTCQRRFPRNCNV